MKNITICADDYGLSPAVSNGILELVKNKRISAVTCMINGDCWPEYAAQLKDYDNIDIGLHINFTEGRSFTSPRSFAVTGMFGGFVSLVVKSLLRRLLYAEVRAEIEAQLDAFVAAIGREPDFIDGHKHIHELPVIRDVVVDICRRRLQGQTHVRYVGPRHLLDLMRSPSRIKRIIVTLLGAWSLRRKLIAHNIPHNCCFAGIYNFNSKKPYRDLFVHFIKYLGNGGIMMCHPGLADDADDKIKDRRLEEWQFFNGDEFLDICRTNKIRVTRFNK